MGVHYLVMPVSALIASGLNHTVVELVCGQIFWNSFCPLVDAVSFFTADVSGLAKYGWLFYMLHISFSG